MNQYDKTPSEVLDYSIDWSGRLNSDTISTSTFSVATGLTKDSETNDTTSATVWLSGGTAGNDYLVTNTVTTAGGRTYQSAFLVRVRPVS